MPKQPQARQVDDAIKALNKMRRDWLRRPNVTAVDVGFKIKGQKVTDDLALRVHVQRKLADDQLGSEAVNTQRKKEKVEGFPVDVIEAEYAASDRPARPLAAHQFLAPEAVDRRGRVDPLVGGVSCGNPRITAGTIGAIVFDKTDGKAAILSNWHVLAGSRAAAAEEEIWQPGRADGGSSGDRVASLSRFRLDRDMDAGLARLTGGRASSRDQLELQPIKGIDEAVLGMQVVKSGRTTGVTKGIIDGVSLSTAINYGGDAGVQAFRDQIHIVPRPPWPAVDTEISLGGDSGSVWVNEANDHAVGLHFAGETDPSPTAENAIANRMVVVAQELNFSFTPLFVAPAPPVDDRWREIIRLILCRRYPWLCQQPRPRIQSEARGCAEEIVRSLAAAPGEVEVESVVDEIMSALNSER